MKQFLIALMILGLFSLSCAADEAPQPPVAAEYVSETMYEPFESPAAVEASVSLQSLTLSATAAVLMERETGKILYEKNPDEQRAPASITKIMTLLLTMEAIESGKLALTDRVVCSAHAAGMGGSQIWLEDGEAMTVDHLLKAVCVASANDAAVALAEHLAGSEEAFVEQMNRRAKALGMNNTHFVNCCGLDAPDHYTTARDIAVMSARLIAHPLITEYSTIWMDTLRDGQTELVNTNKLVRFYEGTTGLKTGTTDQAGYCLSATARKNDMDLIAVVLNGATSDGRFSDAKALLNYGFANFTLVRPQPEELVLAPVTVVHGLAHQVTVVPETPLPILIEKGTQEQLTAKVTLTPQAQAPIAQGQVMGKVTYLIGETPVGECRLLAQTGVQRLTFPLALVRLLRVLIKIG